MPARGCLPEQDHGPSHAALFHSMVGSGLHHDANNHDLHPGTSTQIGVASVSIPHPSADHAELVVVAASPDSA